MPLNLTPVRLICQNNGTYFTLITAAKIPFNGFFLIHWKRGTQNKVNINICSPILTILSAFYVNNLSSKKIHEYFFLWINYMNNSKRFFYFWILDLWGWNNVFNLFVPRVRFGLWFLRKQYEETWRMFVILWNLGLF